MGVPSALSEVRRRSRALTRFLIAVLTTGLALLQPSLAVASARQEPQESVTTGSHQGAAPEDVRNLPDTSAPPRLVFPSGLFVVSPSDPASPAFDGTHSGRFQAGTPASGGATRPSTAWTGQRVRPDGQSQGKQKAHSREYYVAFGMVGAAAGAIGGYCWITATRKGTPRSTADAFKLGFGIPLFSFGSVGAIWAFWRVR